LLLRPPQGTNDRGRRSKDTGLAATKKPIYQDKVDLLAGHVWPEILIASSEYVLKAGTIFIGANAGALLRAGERVLDAVLASREKALPLL
jgi:branched-chain amino acid transport system substrate-binding protein